MTTNEDRLRLINRSIVLCDTLAKMPGEGGPVAKQRAKDLREERKQLQQLMGIRPAQT